MSQLLLPFNELITDLPQGCCEWPRDQIDFELALLRSRIQRGQEVRLRVTGEGA